jgi:hypothetical protein
MSNFDDKTLLSRESRNEKLYNTYDLEYTNHLKNLFKLCDSKIKERFNAHTDIMSQYVFNSTELLAVLETYKNNNEFMKSSRMWDNFVSNANNYKPSQNCFIL